MFKIQIIVFVLVLLVVVACGTAKKAATIVSYEPTSAASVPSFLAPPNRGVIEPGDAELAAIKMRYSEVSMETLNEGHTLYTGVCRNCHLAFSIYDIAEDRWPYILADMAKKAEITSVQKDAIYKYILAVKATQPK